MKRIDLPMALLFGSIIAAVIWQAITPAGDKCRAAGGHYYLFAPHCTRMIVERIEP
jgi:hypothetical protein